MHKTSIEQTPERELGELVSRMVATAPNPLKWRYGLYRINPLVQDQVIIEFGGEDECERYYGRQIPSNEVQSDAGRKVVADSATDILGAALQKLHLQIVSPRYIGEESLETETYFDADPQSFDAELCGQLGISEEIADEYTSDRLADELLSLGIENDRSRLHKLILTAEDFDFTVEQSAQLAPRLLDIAVQYRESNDAQDAPAVFSAIRTGASMLRPNEASRLLLLLEPGHPIDTCLVALKMVGRIFEAQPPCGLDQHTDLAREVRGIADALLNRYSIGSSQSAAMAQLAVYALAAMASSETLDIARIVQRLGVSWFTHQVSRNLRELQSSWNTRSIPVAPEVLGLLDRATHEL